MKDVQGLAWVLWNHWGWDNQNEKAAHMDSLLGFINGIFVIKGQLIDLDVAIDDSTRALLVGLQMDFIAGFEIVRPTGEQLISG